MQCVCHGGSSCRVRHMKLTSNYYRIHEHSFYKQTSNDLLRCAVVTHVAVCSVV